MWRARFGVRRKTLHVWLAKYEAGGLENLGDRSHRTRSFPHQMSADVEVAIATMGHAHPSWGPRRRRDKKWKRWERGVPMELWQMDTVGGFVLADGTWAKALTGVDDHSRFCISAFVMVRESSQRVCDGLALAMRTWGVPGQILTDNGKVFTGRFKPAPG